MSAANLAQTTPVNYEPPELVTHSGATYWFVTQRGAKWHLLYRTGAGPMKPQHSYGTRQAAIAAAYRYASY